jgi:hypothetical protein
MSANASKDFNKLRADFVVRARAPELAASVFKLAHLIAYKYMNGETEKTRYVGQDEMAADLNATARTVQNLLAVLKRLGLRIELLGNGRGNARIYRIEAVTRTERAKPVSSFSTTKRAKSETAKGRNSTTLKGEMDFAPSKKDSKKSPLGELKLSPRDGERETPLRGEEIPPLGGHPPAPSAGARQGSFPLAAPPNARTESKRTREEEITERAEINPPVAGRDSGDDWRELRALYQRGNPSDDNPKEVAIARAAHKRACERAEHSEIMAGARAWVEAKKAGDGVWFLSPLAKWLDGDGWTKPPPKKPKRQHVGNGKAQRHDKDDPMRTALLMGGYVEDEDGNLYNPNGNAGSSFDFRPAS